MMELTSQFVVVPRMLLARIGVGSVCVVWSTFVAAGLLVRRSPCLEDHKALVAYPCFLIYCIFAMLTIY